MRVTSLKIEQNQKFTVHTAHTKIRKDQVGGWAALCMFHVLLAAVNTNAVQVTMNVTLYRNIALGGMLMYQKQGKCKFTSFLN